MTLTGRVPTGGMIEEFIVDRHGLRFEVECIEEKRSWIIHLSHDGVKAGYVRCTVENQMVRLNDFVVYSSSDVIEKPRERWLRKLLRRPARLSRFQGRGLGSALVTYLVEKARARRSKEIFGVISRTDFNRSPELLRWYEHRGFAVTRITDSEDLVASISLEL